jgi:biopolymer transport protein ExbD
MALAGPKSGEEGDEGIFAEINITPLTDIFLVLLIIFMVTSSVMAADQGARAGVKVNLPRGAAREISTSGHDITVAITTEGKMVVDGKEVSADTLKQRFADASAKDAETQVIVQADEATHHGRVVAVMELAKSAGLRRLAIATRRAK